MPVRTIATLHVGQPVTDVANPAPFSATLAFGRICTVSVQLEQVLAVLAIAGLALIPAIGKLGAVLFLAAGVGLILLRPADIIKTATQNWLVLLLPAFCVFSFIWSREPTLSLRFGLQLLATVAIALAIYRRLSPRAFCLTLFGCLGALMVASLLFGNVRSDIGAWTGIYGSKNALAGAASMFVVVSLGVALNSRHRPILRIVAIGGFFLGFALVILAQSVSALGLLPPTLIVMLLLVGSRSLGRLRATVICTFALLFLAILTLVVQANSSAVMAYVLETTGKDVTLTGRTELWAVALNLISERPLLGVGYQAFWVKGHADAEALWAIFGIDSRGGFNFHNMYLSNAVEIGILGVLLQTVMLLGSAILTAIWAMRTANAVPALLFALSFMVLMGSLVEVPLFFQFSLRTIIVFATFAYARDALRFGHAMAEPHTP